MPSDRWQDADDDGMANWEEYNRIARIHHSQKRTQTAHLRSGL